MNDDLEIRRIEALENIAKSLKSIYPVLCFIGASIGGAIVGCIIFYATH